MGRKFVLFLAGIVLLVALSAGTAWVSAQRTGGGMPFFPGPPVGRYTVAHYSAKQIVILDTATGDLYKATPDDYKSLKERPKPQPIALPDRFPDREKDKDKGRFFDKEGRKGGDKDKEDKD
jgi:hypothetical protein